jgi:2-dehydro-3-deoxygluconokinase
MTASRFDLYTAGEAMALLLADDQVPLRHAMSFQRSVAGSESNVATGVARLGHRVAFAGRIGQDAAGEWVRDALRVEGIDTNGLITDPRRPTALLLRDRPAGRPVTVAYYRSASAGAALSPQDLCPEAVAAARCVFVSGITAMLSPDAAGYVRQLLAVARDAGVPVLFDPNVRLKLGAIEAWRDHFDYALPYIDTLLAGERELAILGGDPAALCRRRVQTVVVKRGSAGASVYTANDVIHHGARPVPVVDPVGAGDAFDAGWISALLRGLGPAASLREAAAVASFVVAAPTDTLGLPSAEERDSALGEDPDDVHR